MNDADQKLIKDYLETVAEYGTLPYGLTSKDMEERDHLIHGRFINVTGDARFISEAKRDAAGGESDGLMRQRMEDATRRMRREMTQPLPYTPEPPEYDVLCACGYRRGEHLGEDHTGIWVLANAFPEKYSCPGFTPAITDTGRAS